MKLTLFKTSFLFITILNSSCASIVSKTAYPVYIRTSPAKANVSITDKKGKEVFKGKSPAHVTLKSGAGYFAKAEYQVKLSAPGFSEKIVPINYKLNGWYFGNLLFGGIIGLLIVDPATGAMWKISDPIIDENLEQTANSTVLTPTLSIIEIKDVSAANRTRLVRIN